MVQAYPLQWPKGWPRTENHRFSRFKTNPGKAISDLLIELKRLRARNIVISSNLTTYRKDSIDIPHAGQTHIDDPGLGAYSEGVSGTKSCFIEGSMFENIRCN